MLSGGSAARCRTQLLAVIQSSAMDHDAVTDHLPASDLPQQGQAEIACLHVKLLSFHTVLWSQIVLSALYSGRGFGLFASACSSCIPNKRNGYPFCKHKQENQRKCVLCS